MTAAKIEGKPAAAASAGLDPYIQPLYATPGKRVIGVVELRHVERTQVAADEDKEQSVKLRMTHLEIARPEQEESLRKALQALFLHRTASGTLTEDGELELSDQTLRLTADTLHGLEAARLRAAVAHWRSQARAAVGRQQSTAGDLMADLRAIADGLDAVLYAAGDETATDA